MMLLKKNQILTMYYNSMEKSGGLAGIRNEEILDYSIESINANIFNTELYPTIVDKACRLSFNLIMNHPFHDGNKRIGYYCLTTTLELNGFYLKLKEKEIIELIYRLAGSGSSKLEYEDFVQIIKNNVIEKTVKK